MDTGRAMGGPRSRTRQYVEEPDRAQRGTHARIGRSSRELVRDAGWSREARLVPDSLTRAVALMNSLARFAVFKLPALAYMACIFFASSGPVESASLLRFPDYFLHCAAYTLLYVLVHLAVHEGLDEKARRGGIVTPLVITVLYGLSDEYHQTFVPSRDASATDFLADSAGGILGIATVIVLASLLDRFRRAR